MFFKKLFPSVFLAVLLSQVSALPSPALHGNATRIDVPAHYNPEVLYETYGEGVELPSGMVKESLEDTAVSFAMHKLNVATDQVVHRSGFSSDVTHHAYLSQVHNGIPFVNAVANVAMRDGKVVAFGASFAKIDKIASSQPTVDKKTAIAAAEAALDCTYNSHPTTLEYLARPDGSVALVHVIQVKNDHTGRWYEAYVDAHSAQLLSTVDFVADASYNVVPVFKGSILDGQSLQIDPQDMRASPLGWHKYAQNTWTTTRGNNGYAFRESDNYFPKQTSNGDNYNYRFDMRQDPDVAGNIDAATVNAFYVMNTVHDFAYLYGFNEAAYNYQFDNFNRGGRGGDGVVVSVHNKNGYNNAFFQAPPEGQSGVCTLQLFTLTRPYKTSAMDNTILVHEFCHGITIRRVGGGTSRCMNAAISRGLGEGWADAMADWTEQTTRNTQDFAPGTYVLPNEMNGIRRYPYSTNARVNPLKYSDFAKGREEHDVGEVWANMLHNIYAVLVENFGYAADARTNPDQSAGNVVYMHLFMDSLPLLPCSPDFIAARDGFIQADMNRYQGRHLCVLWKAFAARGFGIDARGYNDGFNIPAKICGA